MKILIKDIVNIQTGLFAKPSGIGDVVYLQSKHFNESGQLNAAIYPDLKIDGISEKHLLKEGDVLFAAKGTKNFATVYENKNPLAVASTSFFVIRLTSKNVLPEFLAWFLNQSQTQTLLKGKAKGTAIPSITKSILEDLKLEVPSIAKQQMIIKIWKLALRESELREKISAKKNQLIENQIINFLK